MSSTQSQQTSASDDSTIDSRKRKRMISNRESARRSRMKKQQHLEEQINRVAQLKNENDQIAMQISLLTQQFLAVDGANSILRTEMMELTRKLESLNYVLRFVEKFSGLKMDIQVVPSPSLEPWQLPFPGVPIVAYHDMFQF